MDKSSRRLSRIAIAAIASPLSGLMSLFLTDVIEGWRAIVSFGLIVWSIPLGHLALWRISRSKGQMWGKRFASAGLVMGYGLIVALILFFPVTTSRIAANESVTVGTIRGINLAQADHKTVNPTNDYSCSLSALSAELTERTGMEPARAKEFVAAGTRSGYIFRVWCPTTASKHYLVSAVPRLPGESGQRSFCSDESQVIRYSNKPDEQSCIREGAPLL
jgi:type IV pilus assembly protein PilA